MSDIKSAVSIRAYQQSDFSFVIATFLRGLYYGDSWFSMVPKDIFMRFYAKIVESLLVNGKNAVIIACDKTDPDTIMGYALMSNDGSTIHWVYVKKAWRNKGVAKLMIPKGFSIVTHLNNEGKEIIKKYPEVIFNPFAL